MLSSTSLTAQEYSLQQCIDSAWTNNARMNILDQKSKGVDLKAKEVQANLIPKVYLNADYKYFIDLPYQLMPQSIFGGPNGSFRAVQFGVPHVIAANATIQIPIYMGQIYSAIQKVDFAKAELAIQIEKSKEDIYFEVTTLYRNAQLLQNKLNFLDTATVNTSKLLSLAKNLQLADLATSTDVKKVQLQLMMLENQKLKVSSSVSQVLDALKIYMGISVTDPLTINPLVEDFTQKLYNANPALAIESIQLHQKMLEHDIVALQKSRYLPDIASYGSVGTSGFGYHSEASSFLDFYPVNFIGIKASYPIFNGTVTKKQIEQKQIELNTTAIELGAVNDQTILSLQKAETDLSVALEYLDLMDSQLALMSVIVNESTELFKQGMVSTADLLQVHTELLEMEQNRLSAMVDCYAADLQIKKITRNILN